MKLKALNEWLGVGANVGVIAGIVFLGIEISQNTAATRAETYQSRALAVAAIQASLAQAPDDVAELFARTAPSNPDYADAVRNLSGVELWRVRMSASALMRMLDNNLRQCELGNLDDEFCRLIRDDVRAQLPYWELVLGGEIPSVLYRLRNVE